MSRSKGFTIVELLIAVSIVIIIATIVSFIINPQRIFQLARDNQRKLDLNQISQALGRYAVDKDSYPLSTSDYQIENAPWGSSWQPYLSKVPQDPLPPQTYIYLSDGTYFQLYAKLEAEDIQKCIGGCGPNGEYNYGLTSSSKVPVSSFTPQSSPSATVSPSPSQAPVTRYQGSLSASISSPSNPRMTALLISPFDPLFGGNQTLNVDAQDNLSPITSIVATLRTDKETNNYSLSLSSGSSSLGTWTATWKANDSHEQVYNLSLVATNQSGQTSRVDVAFELSLKNARIQPQ